MKFLRYGPVGQEKPGVLDADGQIRDLSQHVSDFGGETVSSDFLNTLKQVDIASLPVVPADVRLGCPLSHTPNFFCIGLNYSKHAAETGMDAPKEPIVFSKASSALSGPNDDVIIPRGSQKSDWEVELGVVIGLEALYVSEEDALDYVSAYCVINDLSEREFQIERGGQWIKGKSAPTFGPVGPYLVTPDEVSDPQDLNVSLMLNGETVQSESTADMIFTVKQIIAHMSQFMKLMPGDIIATGTPSGVGMGMKPQRFLRPGDEMVVSVEGLGSQHQKVVAAE